MRLVARAPHSWEVMRNRNALNSRSGIHRWGYVCSAVCVVLHVSVYVLGGGREVMLENKDKMAIRGLTAPLRTRASEFTKCPRTSEEFKIYRV